MIEVEIVTAWLTPTVLFCIVNLVIGTIFITSSLKPQKYHKHIQDDHPARTPSVFERVKSFNLSIYPTREQEPEIQAQMTRAPSFLQRVKSINLSKYHPAREQEPEHPPHQLEPEIPAQMTRIPSFLERVKSINLSSNQPQHHPAHQQEPKIPAQMVRIPSFLERVKSINLSRYLAHEQEPEHPAHQQEPDRLSTGAEPRVLKKSASEKGAVKGEEEAEEQRRPATTREKGAAEHGGDEAVDAKADDFINRFRQQLKLQRLDSIVRYREMVGRGTGR
ncbi:hypothetical protein STAS_28785 [Striga asiatica]|uniref:DUF4408 domain-containing protein n=1 Tax=Striga asiatica TaxID=4170 RepID=A0A5A7R174_STRAF|nr:hypothetical protein STAS_28785 [Striga asiatica]